MDPADFAEIHRLFHREKRAQREIAHELGLAPKTVRRALRQKTCPHRRMPRRPSLLDPFKKEIDLLLREHPRLPAVRIHEELRSRGYGGGITILKDYVHRLRPKEPAVFSRLHFAPGDAAQVDGADAGVISVPGGRRRLRLFAMTLCYSRMLYVEFTHSEAFEDFLRVHQNGWRFFGGVTQRVLYDNMRTVVLSRSADVVRFHPRLLDVAAHFLFKPVACAPGHPNSKGRVERAIGYARTSLLAGREFRSVEDGNAAAARWLSDVANVRQHGSTRKRPVDLFEEERPLLAPLPEVPYDVAVIRTVRVTPDSRVHFETNTYSVPPRSVGRDLVLRATAHEVILFDDGQEIARHRRFTGRGEDALLPEHGEAILKSRPRAPRPVLERRFRDLGPEAEAYLAGLVRAEVRLSLHLRRLAGLLDLYGRADFVAALRQAIGHEAFGWDYVQEILLQIRRRRQELPPTPLGLSHRPELEAIDLTERDLEDYDRRLLPHPDDAVDSDDEGDVE